MLLLRSRVVLLVALATFTATPCRLTAQDSNSQTKPPDSTYDSQRKFAMELFRQNHHLEALPVLQELAKQKPDDAEVLFAWGACLVDHSATVSDEAAAAQERVQARQLLLRAKELGNNSGLLLNLLEMLPEDGFVHHANNADIDQAMRDGEAAFAKNDYDAAIAAYSRAYQADPKMYAAVLFIGDSYFAKKGFPNATTWYERYRHRSKCRNRIPLRSGHAHQERRNGKGAHTIHPGRGRQSLYRRHLACAASLG